MLQTLFVDCSEAWALANQSFHDWVIPEADYEKPFMAPESSKPEFFHVENLHEGSKYAGALPWKFTAYKKVLTSVFAARLHHLESPMLTVAVC